MLKLEILEGRFIEGEYVTLSIDGKAMKRKVHYSKEAGDLFIWYNNSKYFYYEFMKGEEQ